MESPSKRSRRSQRLPNLPTRFSSLFHRVDPTIPSKMTLIHQEPNIFLINNFLLPSELQYFDNLCSDREKEFQASFTEGPDQKLISEERTSTFIHLKKGKDKFIRRIEQRAAELIGLPQENVEPLQVVSYTVGQKFDLHHDAGVLLDDEKSVDLVPPRRLATFFVYLNTLPEGQGHTEFPFLSSLEKQSEDSPHNEQQDNLDHDHDSKPPPETKEKPLIPFHDSPSIPPLESSLPPTNTTISVSSSISSSTPSSSTSSPFSPSPVISSPSPCSPPDNPTTHPSLSVRPQRGCALLFPNVLPSGLPDPLTCHRALPVLTPELRKSVFGF